MDYTIQKDDLWNITKKQYNLSNDQNNAKKNQASNPNTIFGGTKSSFLSEKELQEDTNILREQPSNSKAKSLSTNNSIKKEQPTKFLFNNDRSLTIYSDHMSLLDNKTNEFRTFWDRDHNGAYEEENIITGKNKCAKYKIEESKYDVKKFQQEQISALNLNDKDYSKSKAKINGKIESFAQGNTGDCWALTGLKALSGTKEGAKEIKNAISQDENGNVTVNLKRTNEKYTFSPEEINKAQGKKAFGDPDVIAFELALEKHREKLLKDPNFKEGNKNIEQSVGSGTLEEPLDGGYPSEVFALLTDKKNVLKLLNPKTYSKPSKEADTIINNLMYLKEINPNRNAVAVSFIKKEGPVITHHAYSVEKVDKEYVTLSNPHNSLKGIKIKRKDFVKNCATMSFVDMEGS